MKRHVEEEVEEEEEEEEEEKEEEEEDKAKLIPEYPGTVRRPLTNQQTYLSLHNLERHLSKGFTPHLRI